DPGGLAVHGERLGAVVGHLRVLAEVGDHARGGGVALEDRDRGVLEAGVAALVLGEGDTAQVDHAVPVALDVARIGTDLGEVGERGRVPARAPVLGQGVLEVAAAHRPGAGGGCGVRVPRHGAL